MSAEQIKIGKFFGGKIRIVTGLLRLSDTQSHGVRCTLCLIARVFRELILLNNTKTGVQKAEILFTLIYCFRYE